MNRSALLASLVAVLALTAGTAAPAVTADASRVDGTTGNAAAPAGSGGIHNVTSRLTLDGTPDASGSGLPGPDLAATLSMGHAEFGQRLDALTVERRLSLVGTTDARTRIIRAKLDDLESRLDALRETERRAVRRYANNETTLRGLARALARVRSTALAIDEELVRLRSRTSNRVLEDRIDAMRARIETFTGPVRAHLQRAITAESVEISRVSVATTPDGYVLGAIVEGQYVREALRYDHRDPDGTPTLTTAPEGLERAQELYPETNRENVSFGTTFYADEPRIVRTAIEYTYGTADVYIDTVTAEVFYEERRVDLEGVPTHETVNTTNGSLRLVVERTFDNGPTKVRVVDPATGDPVDAVVRIDGQRVGRTGDDGVLWVVEPVDGYTLVVSADGATVTATVPDGDPE